MPAGATTPRPSTDASSDDAGFMRHALGLAERGLGRARPNPMVGAVVVSGGEVVVGEGWHLGPGTDHAEIMALSAAGDRARGATLFVTLEPCSHQRRTPPCARAVVDAGVARVVAAVRDPNPAVDGEGFRILKEAGVDVEEGLLEAEGVALIEGFASAMTSGRPFVTLKMAASLDGKTAARDGSSRWITGEPARRDVHAMRARAGAIVVGAGTALADDPSLTVRLDGYEGRQPLRVLLDGSGRVPATVALFDGSAPTLVVTTRRASAHRFEEWGGHGASVLVDDGDVPSLASLMVYLCESRHRVQEVLIEGGPTVAWSAIEEGVVDRFVLYLAPKLVGGSSAPGILGGAGVASIAEAAGARVERIERIGEDLKVVADVHRDR